MKPIVGKDLGNLMTRKKNGHPKERGNSGLWVEMPTPATRQKDMYMRASSLAEGTRLSGKRVSALMRRGAIEGVKVEGEWVGTRSALNRYLSADKTRGT